jgi:hypothetical protein
VSKDDPDAEQAVRREHEREHQGNYRAQAPRHLGEAHQLAACPAWGQLPHEGERGGHVGTDGKPYQEGADDEHRGVERKDHPQGTECVEEKIVLIDPLPAQEVAEPAPDHRADRRPDRVRADGRE